MPKDHPFCNAPTRRGGLCQNPSPDGLGCRLHRQAGLNEEASDRLAILQEAAEQRALNAHALGDGSEDAGLDMVFNRNARLAATLARTRQALEHGKSDPVEAEEVSVVTYRIPDNGR